jgi:nucleoid DNA-binding protein
VELDAARTDTITGLASFTLTRGSERPGRNPAPGETITIPAKNYANYRASTGLMDRGAE